MKRKLTLIISILIIFALSGYILFLIYIPVNKELILENKSPISFEQYIKSKSPDSLVYQPKEKQITVSYSIPEQDLSNILWSTYKSSDAFQNKAVKIERLYTKLIGDNSLELSAVINILDIIPSQLSVTLSSHIDEDTIIITLKKTQLGRIQLPNKFVIDKLKSSESPNLKVNTENNELIIENSLKDIAKINAIALDSDYIKVTAILPVASINDLLKLMNLEIFNTIKDSF